MRGTLSKKWAIIPLLYVTGSLLQPYSMAACNLPNAGKTCTPGRKYVRGEIQHAQITGAHAEISTQYGTLCGAQVNSTVSAAQAAWIGVQNSGKWAQTGWANLRGA